MIDAFSCIEHDSNLAKYNSKEKRRIKKHSEEMNDFLRYEALNEQKKGLNATHLFINKKNNELIAYISLCNDSIKLEINEKCSLNFNYSTIPATKIARLAVSNTYQGLKFGRLLIDYSVYIAKTTSEISGTAFITLDCYKHRQSYYESIGFVKNQLQQYDLNKDLPISMRLSINEHLSKIGNSLKEPIIA